MRIYWQCAFAAGAVATSVSHAAVQWTGVNLAGAEFGTKPGVYGTNYTYPTTAEINYFVGRGMNVLRVPFAWERMQSTLGGALNAAELQRLTNFTNAATAAGASVILDPHNYGRYNGVAIGAAGGPTDTQFANFWSRLATTFKGNAKVAFGLMNEPYSMPSTEGWVGSANAAIAAIRTAGAGNMILVPGVRYSGAHSWYSSSPGQTSNAVNMLNIVDPANNYAFEVHQYLDTDSSGSKTVPAEQVVSTTVGRQRIEAFTNWLRTNNKRGFLGEFAVPNSLIGDGASQIGDEAVTNMLDYMDANADVWKGWTWWAAGPWWGDYMFTMEPTDLGKPTQTDRPSMTLLEGRLAGVPEPASMLAAAAGAGLLLRRVRRR